MSEQLKDLIERQLETSGNCLGRVEEEFSATGKFDSASLIMFCGGLFQIVQNLQNRIDGILEAYEDVRRRNDSLMDTVRKLKGGAK